MAYKAEALTLLIDVNPSVNDAAPGEDSFLQKSVTAANMIIQRKMFTDTRATKNEASLILFGTDGTSNNLYEDGEEGYKHITIAKELGIMDLELLKFINKNIQSGAYCADFLDALVVALDHMHDRCIGRKMEQKVILFTNLNSEFAEDKLDVITRAFKDNNVSLVFVGPDIADGDDSSDSGHGELKKPMTPQQEIGSKCMRHILEEVDGEGISANEVLPMLSFFESRRRNQVTTFRGPIEIGSSLKINSYAYVKCQQERPPSWKKSSALAEYGPNGQSLQVQIQRSYHHNDEDRNEVDKENIAQAYRYGKTLVPMTDDDKKSLKQESTKGCVVLGFTSRENVVRKLYSRNTCYMFTPMPDDEHAAVAFSALCHALEEKNMVAIVRFVFRANADPKLGFLSPHIKSSYESLVFISLPFREDIRQYYFPPLDGVKTEKTNFNQKQAINGLISNMMLVQENDDGEEEDLLKPKDILNPVTQRFFQCIQYRALNPEQTRIPEIEEYILNAVQPISEMVAKCQVPFDEIKSCFPLQKVSKETKSVNMFNEPVNDGEPEEKKQKLESSNESDVFTLHGFAKSHVREIDTADPIGSFSVLVDGASSDTFLDVCEKMRDCTLRLILDSFLDQYYNKAISCLDVMRKECVNYKVSSVFNKLLLQIKDETLGKRKNDFWELLKRENILPISQDDADDSSFTIEDAQKFYTPVEEKPAVSKDEPDNLLDDEDDLLDML